MEQFENFIGFNPWTALFTLLNLVLTFLILKKFLFKPVNKMIDDRQKEIDDLYADATEARTAAEHMQADYDRKLSEAKDASAQIIAEATQEAHRRRDDMIVHAQSDADAIRDYVRRKIGVLRPVLKVAVIDEFPTNEGGKILYGALLERAKRIIG